MKSDCPAPRPAEAETGGAPAAASDPVVKVALPVPLDRVFDYLPPEPASWCPLPGSRVLAPFGRRSLVGVVVGSGPAEVAAGDLRRLSRVLDREPALAAPMLALCRWLAHYYHAPLGEVCQAALPVKLRRPAGVPAPPERWWTRASPAPAPGDPGLARAHRQRAVLEALTAGPLPEATLRERAAVPGAVVRALAERGWIAASAPPRPRIRPGAVGLNKAQARAVGAIRKASGTFAVHLLHGVTGSGKTEVYLAVIEPLLAAGRQALVLVPEIGLTPQLCRRFERRFGDAVGVVHSELTDTERLRVWSRMRTGELAVTLGTRSALFTPMVRPGLIVVDEEHDASFKQQDGVRYSARDAAVMRGRKLGIPVVLGSATPSLESLHNVRSGRYRQLELPHRAGGARMPTLEVCDLRTEVVEDGLARTVLARMAAALGRGEQVLVFLNRRGFSPVLMCQACGWYGQCARCDARLVLHRADDRLRCHHCGHDRPRPRRCPACASARLRPVGEGTERLEQHLAARFPGIPIVRLDRDAVRGRAALAEALGAIRAGAAKLIIGTQMLAKGHDFPGVTLAVIVDLDQALFSSDFRAPERAAQLLTQVAGRAGRGALAGTLVLQTAHPDHGLFRSVLRDGYLAYAEGLLAERQAAGFPPFGHIALVRAEAPRRDAAEGALTAAVQIADPVPPGVYLYGPMPCVMERRAGRHRFQLWLQARERAPLHALLDRWWPQARRLDAARRVRLALDVDPLEAL